LIKQQKDKHHRRHNDVPGYQEEMFGAQHSGFYRDNWSY
jgi:hypothetical protein